MLKEGFVFMFISSFMALSAVANPAGSGFIVNGILSHLNSRLRKSIIRRIVAEHLTIGLGNPAISLFGLSAPAIELGGGLPICKRAQQRFSAPDSSMGDKENKTVDPAALENKFAALLFALRSAQPAPSDVVSDRTQYDKNNILLTLKFPSHEFADTNQ